MKVNLQNLKKKLFSSYNLIILTVIFVCLYTASYFLKHSIHKNTKELGQIEKETQDNKKKMKVLNAKLSSLTSNKRLEALSEKHLPDYERVNKKDKIYIEEVEINQNVYSDK